MAFLHIPNVSMKGLSACVPERILENKLYPGYATIEEAEMIMAAIGIERRRISDLNVCTSDLCCTAAERLINDLKWDKSKIDCLIFVTQTPDYILPATSCSLQNRLGLKEDTFVLDISLGCSGWIYGLKVLSSLLSHGYMRRGLLLVGETLSKICSPEDKSTYPLFGDAGTATAIEFKDGSPGFKFHTATDGRGYKDLIIYDGGYRNQVSASSLEMFEIKPGIKRNKLHMVLDGMNILSFSISRAPESIIQISEKFGIGLEAVDYFLFHQANLFINERIRNKLKLPIEKVPYSLRNYGNTGSATIPLTMITEIGHDLRNNKRDIIACGFGGGLSWGSAHFFTEGIICSELITF
jgi:3-oxoacyl-[acyl-carrier-protein] synthase-3